MGTTPEDVQRWFNSGVKDDAAYMIVMVDTYDHGDYPVYVGPEDDIHKALTFRRMQPMQRIMEVYDLSMDRDKQLAEYRAFNYPPFPTEDDSAEDDSS